jgi:hypothetical protein
MKYYELNSFSIALNADLIAQVAGGLTIKNRKE